MNRHDLMPGHRLIRLRRDERGSVVSTGDVLIEHGPRIGERWWLIVAHEHCQVLDHVAAQLVDPHDRCGLAVDGVTVWKLTR